MTSYNDSQFSPVLF